MVKLSKMIKVSLNTWKTLKKIKTHPRETFEDVIDNLLKKRNG